MDWQQFSVERRGRREDYVFLLPGGLMSTREMVAGKMGETGVQTTLESGGGGVGVKA